MNYIVVYRQQGEPKMEFFKYRDESDVAYKRSTLIRNEDDVIDIMQKHYHINCRQCGRFIDVPLDYHKHLDNLVSDLTGYKVDNHDIVFNGLCSACRKASLDNTDKKED